MKMQYSRSSFLAFTIALATCLPAAAVPSAHSGQTAAELYDKGKFSEAQRSYETSVGTETQAARLKTDQLAKDLLGLARSQAAAGNFADAEKTFTRALNLAESMQMPRTFVDQVRAGLVEMQVKLGHQTSQDSSGNTAELAPLPVPGPNRATPNPTMRHYVVGFPMNGNFLPSLIGGAHNREPEEDEYLRRCAVSYNEHVHGAQSLQAALSNLDLSSFYANQRNYDSASVPVQKVAAILPKLNPNEQRALSSSLLETAVRFADLDQTLLASQITQPILKLATPQWDNVPDLSSKLSRLSDSLQRKQDFSQAETFEKYAVTLLERSLDAQDPRLASERLKLSALFEAENKPGSAIELYEMALPVLENTGNANQVIKPYSSLASLCLKTGSNKKAKDAAQKLVKALTHVQSDNDRSWVRPCLDLSANLARSGDLDTARQIYKETFNHSDVDRDRFGFDFQMNEAVKSLVSQLEEMGQPQEVENVYLALVESRKNALGETESAIGAYADLAEWYIKQRFFDKAKAAADHVAVNVKKFGRSSRYYNRLPLLARAFQQQDQSAEALLLTQAAIDLNPDASANDVRDAGDNYMRAASILFKQGNKEKAQAMVEKAVSMINKLLPPDCSSLASPLSNVVDHQIQSGHTDNASQLVVEMAQYVQLSQQTHMNQAFTNQLVNRLTTALEAEGMADSACVIYKQSLERQSKATGPSSIEVASVMQQYGNALRNAGKTQEATDMQNNSAAIWDVYNRQNRGEAGVYRPFAPLSETLRTYQMHRMTPDSST
jgi:tetratricopeptide (TPR) repeat protein